MKYFSIQRLAGISVILLILSSILPMLKFIDFTNASEFLFSLSSLIKFRLVPLIPIMLVGRYFFELSKETEKTKLNSVSSFLIVISSIFLFLNSIWLDRCDSFDCLITNGYILWIFTFIMFIAVLLTFLDRRIKYGFKSKKFFFSLLFLGPYIIIEAISGIPISIHLFKLGGWIF